MTGKYVKMRLMGWALSQSGHGRVQRGDSVKTQREEHPSQGERHQTKLTVLRRDLKLPASSMGRK